MKIPLAWHNNVILLSAIHAYVIAAGYGCFILDNTQYFSGKYGIIIIKGIKNCIQNGYLHCIDDNEQNRIIVYFPKIAVIKHHYNVPTAAAPRLRGGLLRELYSAIIFSFRGLNTNVRTNSYTVCGYTNYVTSELIY